MPILYYDKLITSNSIDLVNNTNIILDNIIRENVNKTDIVFKKIDHLYKDKQNNITYLKTEYKKIKIYNAHIINDFISQYFKNCIHNNTSKNTQKEVKIIVINNNFIKLDLQDDFIDIDNEFIKLEVYPYYKIISIIDKDIDINNIHNIHLKNYEIIIGAKNIDLNMIKNAIQINFEVKNISINCTINKFKTILKFKSNDYIESILMKYL